MKNDGGNKLDNLSSLSARLIEVEREHVKCEDGTEVDVRQDLIDALGQFNSSRYRFGKALAAYKVFFAEERAWMQAAEIIAQAIGCDERTVRRIVDDYVRASQAPEEAIEELEAQGLDPAAKKNAPVLASIVEMPTGQVKAKPKEAVAQAVKMVKAAKAAKKTMTAEAPTQSDAAQVEHVSELSREEKQLLAVRSKIRTALANTPNNRKLDEILRALEEEMYEVWGLRDAVAITLTPRPSSLTIDGRRKLEVAA